MPSTLFPSAVPLRLSFIFHHPRTCCKKQAMKKSQRGFKRAKTADEDDDTPGVYSKAYKKFRAATGREIVTTNTKQEVTVEKTKSRGTRNTNKYKSVNETKPTPGAKTTNGQVKQQQKSPSAPKVAKVKVQDQPVGPTPSQTLTPKSLPPDSKKKFSDYNLSIGIAIKEVCKLEDLRPIQELSFPFLCMLCLFATILWIAC